MPISTAMIEARRQWIGSSDVSAILGLSKFRTAYDLFLEKSGQLEASPSSKAANAGNRFEAGVLDEAEEKLGPIERNVHLKAAGVPFPLATNLDGRVIATGNPVEAKTAGLFGPLTEEWGEDGTDQVPDAYIPQAQVHLLITNKEICHAPAFLGGRGFAMFEVPRNDELLKIIIERCAAFWEHVRNGTPPEYSPPSLEIVRRLRRTPGKTISIPSELISNCLCAREAAKEAEAVREAADAALLAAMGDAEIGECGAGEATYTLVNRKAYTVKESSYRTLRIKKKK